jgi:RNA polymerase sigma-70 factor (ECF subfamily)
MSVLAFERPLQPEALALAPAPSLYPWGRSPLVAAPKTAADLLRKRVKSSSRRRERLSLRTRGAGAVAGAEAMITALYHEHGGCMLAYATRLTGDRGAAEDVVQETLLRAWRHPEVLVNGQGSVRGWLLTVARNIVVDRARARSARPTEVAEQPAKPPIATDRPEDVVEGLAVLSAVEQLSAEHRNVLVELYWRGTSVAEAAQRLGVPPGTVKSRAHYALQSLRTTMAAVAEREPA